MSVFLVYRHDHSSSLNQVQTFETDFGLQAVALNSSNGACSPLVIRVCFVSSVIFYICI